ncbi:hypothetical protein ABZ154_15455 [Streptomyces sp. NPDC006261]|uniref:hypothetical protein n=1 Tax=Streptomyces sp. NPDC006261 TaxID=3156739 RepID=UPI0033B34FA3
MFGRKAAEKLDSAAGALHRAGTKAAGKAGGRAGDAVANAVLAPIRNQIDVPCTCKGRCPHK